MAKNNSARQHADVTPDVEPSRRKRITGAEREAAIIAEATALFADNGFGATTRDLASRMGVTQALLYRYFPSKEALIERIFSDRSQGRWNEDWDRLLGDRGQPLETRLIAFYVAYAGRSTSTGMRLFVRANLEGRGLARRYSFPLIERILRPIIGELRHQVGLPEFADQPLMRGERELAMTLHGGIMFIGIRRHIYRMPLPEDTETLVSLQVRTFLAGAPTALATMHEDDADPRLTVPLIESRRDR